MCHWAREAVFYHIYPLGLCGAPRRNDFVSPAVERLNNLLGWLDHIQSLGATALYLGPVFESGSHGYDTADFFAVDRRLGTNGTLSKLASALHARGMRLILDAVFNHVGRDFWAFRDLQARGRSSPYAGWFHGLSFERRNRRGDPFTYEGWNGHDSIVKLEVANPEVRRHIFSAVERWTDEFQIDGLRLDAADCIDMGFLRDLAARCRSLRSDFFLLGEIVHGDYRRWANPETLDSVTNYECYKGLHSSHVDRNYFEIAYSLNRQFGPGGLYTGIPLYNFADNHDVNRLASTLRIPRDAFPLYALLFTMPGVPSVYYGSEWGIPGKKDGTDWPLRPALDIKDTAKPNVELREYIAKLSAIRKGSTALMHGDYRQIHVAHEQIAFLRSTAEERVVVVVNSAGKAVSLRLQLPNVSAGRLTDVLDAGRAFPVHAGAAVLNDVLPSSALIMKVRQDP